MKDEDSGEDVPFTENENENGSKKTDIVLNSVFNEPKETQRWEYSVNIQPFFYPSNQTPFILHIFFFSTTMNTIALNVYNRTRYSSIEDFNYLWTEPQMPTRLKGTTSQACLGRFYSWSFCYG